MATGESVYEHGSDSIYGECAEDAFKRQALNKLEAVLYSNVEVLPGDHVDHDSHGRGIRVVEQEARIATSEEPEIATEHAEQCKKEIKVNIRAVLHSSGLKTFPKRTMAFTKPKSRARASQVEGNEEPVPNQTMQPIEEKQSNVRTAQCKSRLKASSKKTATFVRRKASKRASQSEVDKQPTPTQARQHKKEEQTKNTVLCKFGLQNLGEKTKAFVSRWSLKQAVQPGADEEPIPNQGKNDATDGVASLTVERAKEQTAGREVSKVIDSTPQRVKSKLPCEEARPKIAPGHVSRAIKSWTSLMNSDQENKDVLNIPLAVPESPRAADSSSFPWRVASPVVAKYSTRKEVNISEATRADSRTAYVNEAERPKSVSIVRDEEAHNGLVASDDKLPECLPAPKEIGDGSKDNVSTAGELLTTNPQKEFLLTDYSRRSTSGRNKNVGLFRSCDAASRFDKGSSADFSTAPVGSRTSHGFPSTVTEAEIFDNAKQVGGPVIEVVDSTKETVEGPAGPQNKLESTTEVGGTSIVFHEIVEGSVQDAVEEGLKEDENNAECAMKAQGTFIKNLNCNIAQSQESSEKISATANDIGNTSSPFRMNSGDVVDYNANGESDVDQRAGKEVLGTEESSSNDGRSAMVKSSVVMSCLGEDTNDAEFATNDERAGNSQDAEGKGANYAVQNEVAIRGIFNNARVVDSSDAGAISEARAGNNEDVNQNGLANDADEGGHEEENMPLWQSLRLFGIVISSGWVFF